MADDVDTTKRAEAEQKPTLGGQTTAAKAGVGIPVGQGRDGHTWALEWVSGVSREVLAKLSEKSQQLLGLADICTGDTLTPHHLGNKAGTKIFPAVGDDPYRYITLRFDAIS